MTLKESREAHWKKTLQQSEAKLWSELHQIKSEVKDFSKKINFMIDCGRRRRLGPDPAERAMIALCRGLLRQIKAR